MSKPVMISVSGIRGIVGEGLSPELIVNLASAAGTFYGPGRVFVGRDPRVTGDMVKHAVFAGLIAVGCDPVDLGICATPSVEIAVRRSDAVGGIIITASHNPVEWNALKLLGGEGLFLDAGEGLAVKRIAEEKTFAYKPWDRLGRAGRFDHATRDHIAHILSLSFLDREALRKRRFRVAFDAVNGAGGVIVPQLLETLGCEIFPLNAEPTGLFAHPPEPVPENLRDLAACVLENGADIGFAVDPDADRLAIVDETGTAIGEEYTLALAVRFILSRKPGPVVVNASTSRVIDEIASEYGVKVTRTQVGEIHVSGKMKEIGAVIGGEGNGGVILPDSHLGRDGILAIALTLQQLLEYCGPVSRLWKAQPQFAMSKKKTEIGTADPDRILERLEENHRDLTMDKTDGLKIAGPDSWVQIRKSNTEPIIRVMAEARTKDAANALCDTYLVEIQQLLGPRDV